MRQVTTTLIVTASVPFSLIITLGAIYFAGLSLNMLTMMGLMLAVGMLVDNAVVITESVFRYREQEKSNPFGATLKGVKEVGRDAETGRELVAVDPRYFRPTEVELLQGDPGKAKRVLGWEPTVTFSELVSMMVQADLREQERELYLKNGGFTVKNYYE